MVDGREPESIVFENELFQLRSLPGKVPVPGWLMLLTRRHVAGPAQLNDAEAAALGPNLRHGCAVLERVTGALRIYTAALGEAHPHFHCHLVPRLAELPGGAKGFSVFDLQRQAAEGSLPVDEGATRAMLERLRDAFRAAPLPLG